MFENEFKVLQGNCIDVLKTLPDSSVQCCVTSPPYYGLRDYGTAKWVGGDTDCPHYRTSKYSEKCTTGHKHMMEQGEAVGDSIYKTVCPLCGAVRVDEQIGLEDSPEDYVKAIVEVFREVRRVLKDDGTVWLNLGDSYAGSEGKNSLPNGVKPKDLIGIPWMVAFALRNDGWHLRQDIIWCKLNGLPESVRDRCTKSHEYIFLLSKSPKYFFDHESIQEVATGYDGRKDTVLKGSPKYADQSVVPNTGEQSMAKNGPERWKFKNLAYDGQTPNTMHELRAQGMPDKVYTKIVNGEEVPVRNKRDVRLVATEPYSGAHFATYPTKLIEPCILAGSAKGDTVLDPFNGAGTTGIVALTNGRKYIGIELNAKYVDITLRRFKESFEGVSPHKQVHTDCDGVKRYDFSSIIDD